MKSKSRGYPPQKTDPLVLNESYAMGRQTANDSMVRTQVYLTNAEHTFLQREACRRGEPMSAYLRRIIDEKMAIPDRAWTNNPMLEPTDEDAGVEAPEDGALNHDHYAYGAPKKYKKLRGQWVMKAENEP